MGMGATERVVPAEAGPYLSAVSIEGVLLKAVGLTEHEIAVADRVAVLTDPLECDYRRILALAPVLVDMRNAMWGLLGTDRVVAI
jgi:hypothetical protein